MRQSYSYKTTPMAHQFEAFDRSADEENFALSMEQGTGKTKVAIDTAAYNFNMGRINALVVIAPNGVHRNWVKREIPAHLPDYVPHRCAYWASAPTKAEQRAMDALMEPGQFLRILTVNIEALTVERALKFIQTFLRSTNAMAVVDESQRIKNPQSKRTKNVLALRKHTKIRRILTGTPVTQSPLDVFSQYQFLDPSIWPTTSFTVFRARYAEILPQDSPLVQAIKRKTGKAYGPVMIATDREGRPIYKNLDELRNITAPLTFRVLKKDCLDLPEKVYVRRSVEMTDAQKRAYRDLQRRIKEGLLPDEDFTKPVSKLTAVTYFQQILCGVLPAALSPTGQPEPLYAEGHHPRINAMLDDIEETDESIIVWCRFTDDIRRVASALRAEYGDDSVVEYYGEVSREQREHAIDAFQSKKARFFVGNPSAGGTGLTLTAATQVHYFSNSFKLEDRLQSEDRAHRIGQTNRVRYVDYEVEDTVDSRIISALLMKKDVADAITGDEFIQWIS